MTSKVNLISIAHVVGSINNKCSGIDTAVTELARAQANSSVMAVSVHSIGKSSNETHREFFDIRHRQAASYLPLLSQFGFAPTMVRRLYIENYDIIHNHGLWRMPNVYGGRAAKFKVTPLVFSPHGMLSPTALAISPLKKKMFRVIVQEKVLREANLFHATSESEYQEIRDFGLTQPVVIIPNGIELPALEYPLNSKTRQRYVLFLGRIHPIKGLDNLIRAWSILETSFPDWSLLVVGPDSDGYAADLQKLIRTLGLRNISIRGPVVGEEKNRLLASAGVFILPSKSENFAISVAESLAAGTPVVSSFGAPWRGLQDNRCGWWVGIGVEPTVEALSSAMSLSSTERNKMGERGRAWMQRDFSWSKIAQQFIDAYTWLLDGGEPPNTIRF